MYYCSIFNAIFAQYQENSLEEDEEPNNVTQFHDILLERKEIKMVLIGQCEEIHTIPEYAKTLENAPKNSALFLEMNNNDTLNEDCECMDDKENLDKLIEDSYVTKMTSIVTLICFSMREHSWQSSAPFWDNKKKHVRKNKKFNYRKHVDVSNKTLVQLLDNFTFISAWKLPPFNVHHVGSYECVTRPGLENSQIYLYTEDHRHPAVYRGTTTLETMEYVPVYLPCIPAHPLVDIQLYKWPPYSDLPPGLVYNPRTGYQIEEPVQKKHNGTYLCVFTDNSGTKISKLVIHLNVKRKVNRKVFVEGINVRKEINSALDLKKGWGKLIIFCSAFSLQFFEYCCINCVLFYGN